MRRRSGLVPVQRVHPESGGQTLSDHPHAHPDKTGAAGLAHVLRQTCRRSAVDYVKELGVFFSSSLPDYSGARHDGTLYKQPKDIGLNTEPQKRDMFKKSRLHSVSFGLPLPLTLSV